MIVPEVELEIQLLPVTKLQLRPYLDAPGTDGAAWSEAMAELNPAVEPHDYVPANREGLFATAVLPDEALAYARWLGEGFDLPTLAEWRGVYTHMTHELASAPEVRDLEAKLDGASADARTLFARHLEQFHPRWFLDLSLMRGGLCEWVRDPDGGYVGVGAPRPTFHPNLWNPLTSTVRPTGVGERLKYFGFRLVRRLR